MRLFCACVGCTCTCCSSWRQRCWGRKEASGRTNCSRSLSGPGSPVTRRNQTVMTVSGKNKRKLLSREIEGQKIIMMEEIAVLCYCCGKISRRSVRVENNKHFPVMRPTTILSFKGKGVFFFPLLSNFMKRQKQQCVIESLNSFSSLSITLKPIRCS